MTSKASADRPIQLLCLTLCVLFILFSETAYSAAQNALTLVGRTVLPVLLPFTVLSNAVADTLPQTNRLGSIITAFIIGNICGAPIGAILLERLYENGVLTKKEEEKLLPAVSGASPAFCISAVGICIFNNRNFGILIYSAQFIINLAVLLLFLYKNKRNISIRENKAAFDASVAISKAANALCCVSVSIVFFSVLSAVISDLCNLNSLAECALSSLLEMSGACALARYVDYSFSYIFAAFALGFGGASVLMQVEACTRGISKMPYIICKLITGTVCALTVTINSPFFASSLANPTNL